MWTPIKKSCDLKFRPRGCQASDLGLELLQEANANLTAIVQLLNSGIWTTADIA